METKQNNYQLVAAPLRPFRIQAPDIARVNFSGGAVVCAFIEGETQGAVLIVPTGTGDQLNAAAKELLKVFHPKTSNQIKIKIVGAGPERELIKKVFNGLKVEIRGEAEITRGGVEVFFIPELAKIRVGAMESPKVTTPAAKSSGKKKILIVDDSATIRKLLRQLFESDSSLEVVADTGRPTEVEALIEKCKPDLVTLDIHMPEMDGITLLKRLAQKFTLPIVMISSISYEEGTDILKALELGAVDYIEKPSFDKLTEAGPGILEAISGALEADLSKLKASKKTSAMGFSAPMDLNTPIVIGSSTGGTEALRVLLTALPAEIPPILIVQHIPAIFSEALAKRLNDLCPFEVREAKQGDAVKPGLALIAPGGFHMSVKGSIRTSTVVIEDKPEGYRHKPAVDVLFNSAVKVYGKNCVAVILTGMGKDGAVGMLALRKAGARTVAQDEASCVVYGMPRIAFEMGGVQDVVALEKMPAHLVRLLAKTKTAA